MKSENILNSLTWRYSAKIFDTTKKISDDDWNAIEDALILTPSSFGLQAWKFIVVQNPEMKEKLKNASYQQSQVSDCSHLLVLCSKKDVTQDDIDLYIDSIAKIRNVSLESLNGFKKYIVDTLMHLRPSMGAYLENQVFIALGNVLTVAAMMKIDACPIGGFEREKYDEILKLTDYTTSVVCPFGYRDSTDKYAQLKKVRYSKENLFEYIK